MTSTEMKIRTLKNLLRTYKSLLRIKKSIIKCHIEITGLKLIYCINIKIANNCENGKKFDFLRDAVYCKHGIQKTRKDLTWFRSNLVFWKKEVIHAKKELRNSYFSAKNH